jgi:5-enolpyruvylshikimate-3-phosphate synthase
MRTVTQALVSAGANIESFNRKSTTPMVIDIHVSGAQLLDLKKSLSDSTLESALAITVA